MYLLFIYSLILYTANNTNKEIHKYGTRYNNNLHLPIVNLSKSNKGAYFSGIKIFNPLPEYIKNLFTDQNFFYNHLKQVFISTFLLFN